MSHVPSPQRYDRLSYRTCGRSGLKLPSISLGLWHNFGDDRAYAVSRSIVLRAFDLGITHFDLANNYGPPPGGAEETFGRILATDLRAHRDELVISTKAGYDMWSGPYGEGGSRKYLLASLDQSLRRMGLDYVDIFYSHCPDPATPIEETMGALHTAVRQGKALYPGISSYDPAGTAAAATVLDRLGSPLLIHQPAYSIFDRQVEKTALLDTLEQVGAGCIGFMPLAQGLLSDRYLNGIPPDSRASRKDTLSSDWISDDLLDKIRALDDIAKRRDQSLAQMAIAWTLRDPRMTSTLMGASSIAQLEANVASLDQPALTEEELTEIDQALGMRR